MIICVLVLIGTSLSVICAIINVKNAVETHKYYEAKRKELREQIEKETFEKMNKDIEKYGFVLRKGKWL